MEPLSGLLTRADVRTTGSLVVGGLLTATLLLLAVVDAGFAKTLWLPVGVFVCMLLAVVTIALPDIVRRVPTSTAVAVLALFGFAAWSGLSIAWADARGDAWDGANRTLLYAALYALVALWPWRQSVAVGVMVALSVGIALVGAATLRAAVRADDLESYFVVGVLAEPAGYHNASAALFLLAFWPALVFASRAEMPFFVRPLLLATACLLLELAMLAQSRGSLFAFPISALVLFALVPGRLRLIVAATPVIAAALLARDSLFDVYSAILGGEGSAAVEEAAAAVVFSVAGVAVAGLGLAVLDRRLSIPRRVKVVAGTGVLAVVACGLLLGGVALAASDPVDRARDAWSDFKQYGPEQADADTHFATGLGSNRYDFWRVSLEEFADAPIHGIGADNFAIPYAQDRRTDEEPLYPHSIVLGVLSQTGLVGAALLAVFAAAAVRSASRARNQAPHGGVLFGIGAASVTYLTVHAAGDWLWELPGVAAPALVALALPAGVARAGFEAREQRAPVTTWITAVLFAAIATVSLALPWLALRSTENAVRSWRFDAQGAYAQLDRARRLNPLSDRPDLVAAVIAGRLSDWPRMRVALERALERTPRSWYAELQLAIATAADGRPEEGRLHVARARVLNPRESTIELVDERLASGEPIRPAEIDRIYLRRIEERIR